MKLHINTILKQNVILKAKKISGEEIDRLIEKTVKEQEEVLALKKIDYEKLSNTYIAI